MAARRRRRRRTTSRRPRRTLDQRVTALERAIKPPRAARRTRSAPHVTPIVDAGDGPKYLGAYRI